MDAAAQTPEQPPSGRVTMLFTDIEGSTQLARRLGERWEETLELHYGLLERAILAHGGYVELVEGDAFFATFGDPADGLAAAIDGQRALRAASWPSEPVRVRMGLHVGTVQRGGMGLLGLEVHRAARVAACAHGGQVLATQAIAEAVADPPARGFQDLGQHRLKDFPEPERLLHLVLDGETAERFPPPKTLSVKPGNLPTLATPLVGRDAELEEVRELLSDGARVVTLTGQGGTGKTRLAVAAAAALSEAFAGGAWFVPLAEVREGDRLLPSIAERLRLAPEPDRPLLETLSDRFAAAPTLVVLDNLEQLREGAASIGELVAVAPTLRVLATSQAPLRISAEHVLQLGPLKPPEAMRLFIERARARRPDLDAEAAGEAIAEICARVDNLPLAVELAAARLGALTPRELLARLDSALPMLQGRDRDRPERHRSMRAAIQWSHDLLEPEERELFARLCTFATIFTLEDAETLTGGEVLDGVEALTEFSFLRLVDRRDGVLRFTIAQTLREFGLEGLKRAGLWDLAADDHARWVGAVLEEVWHRHVAAPIEAIDRVAELNEDIRAAAVHSAGRDPRLHLHIVAVGAYVAFGQGLVEELEVLLRRALDRGPGDDVVTARALSALAEFNTGRNDAAENPAILDRARRILAAHGERREVARVAWQQGFSAFFGDQPGAREAAEEALALAREVADPALIDRAVALVAQIDVGEGRPERVEALVHERLTEDVEPVFGLWLRHLWADCALVRGDGAEAVRRYADAIGRLPFGPEDPQSCFELEGLAMALACCGRGAEARTVYECAQDHRRHFKLEEMNGFWSGLIRRFLELEYVSPAGRPEVSEAALVAGRERALELAGRPQPVAGPPVL